MKPERIIIAGPCAAESEEQIDIAIREVKKRDIDFMRINLWKPRTRPGYEGLGEGGLPLLKKVAEAGINPGLEVIMPEHVTLAMDTALPHLREGGNLLLWIGARNQNHMLQKEVARLCQRDPRVMLMVKNQPWPSEDHWVGIIEHVLETGFPKERLLNCNRGFTTAGENPKGFRNVPDFAMMDRVRARTGVPVIYDPSHMGGTVPNVFEIAKMAVGQDIAGIIVEVHHDPANAKVDKNQQVTWPEFDKLRATIFPEQ
jgi:3-deoxy-D-arabino-heptulosonate 7-phosphate (DAHP) synthase